MRRVLLCAALGCSGPAGGEATSAADTTASSDATSEATSAATTTTGATTAGTTADPEPTTGAPDPTTGAADSSSSGCPGACTTTTSATTGGPPGETDCDDGADDDGDDLTDCLDADCWSEGVCTAGFVRVATWNVRGIGAPGSDEYDALLAVLRRIDADIVCLEEVGDDEDPALAALRADAGYAYAAAAPPSGGLIRNACLSRPEIVYWDELGSADLSSDPDARELTRTFLRLRIRLDAVDRYITVLAAHFKAASGDTDRFRRMVEAIRLGRAIALERETYPGNAIVALGDLNEVPDHPQDLVFTDPPADLPPNYVLGADIPLPLEYAPLDVLAAEGVARVEARVEDTTYQQTYVPQLARLDYIYADAGDLVVSEVYEACEDDGVDADPLGDRMPKPGDPLPCGTTATASDHRPVVAVFHFE